MGGRDFQGTVFKLSFEEEKSMDVLRHGVEAIKDTEIGLGKDKEIKKNASISQYIILQENLLH